MMRLIDFLIVAALIFMTGALISISNTLGRIEQDFKIVQELQKDVKHLNKLTECLEPAQEIPLRPERIQEQEGGDGF